jgi:regulator of replication initiation timing
MIMPYPRSENKVHNLILETIELEEQAGKLLIQIDENKKKIQKYFDENGIKQMEVPVSQTSKTETKVVCKKTERVTLKYDVDKLKEKLDDEMFIEVTKRSYSIKDINAMIKLMKDAGVRAKDFKALIEAHVTADSQAIKRLYDAGEITMKTLKGTYQATISKSIKITEETGDKD